jgi:hypothetical protein
VIPSLSPKETPKFNPPFVRPILHLRRESPIKDVGAKKTSGGTILGLSLNFRLWIRDVLAAAFSCCMLDNRNDQMRGSR